MSKIIVFESTVRERKQWLDPCISCQQSHVSIVNQLYLGQAVASEKAAKRALQRKLQSYKNQDRKKNIYNEHFITEEELLEKLVISKLKCKYCRANVLLFYKNVREKKQWTLDRIDNNLGHSNINTVIACLQCNLQRRNTNDKKFLFTKQMRLIKKY